MQLIEEKWQSFICSERVAYLVSYFVYLVLHFVVESAVVNFINLKRAKNMNFVETCLNKFVNKNYSCLSTGISKMLRCSELYEGVFTNLCVFQHMS